MPTRPNILAADLDGTILKYRDFEEPLGEPIPGIQRELAAVKAAGWAVIIWTVRRNISAIKEHLDKHKVPYDYINENPWGPDNDSSRKIAAHVYLDDRAMQFNGDTTGLAEKVLAFKPWYKVPWEGE